jgi:AcrR family transcriptional regulator
MASSLRKPKLRPAPRLTQAERSLLSHRRLLDAAARVMCERGYEDTTLAAIGAAAGYSRGLATHRFGAKTDLFAELMRSVTRGFYARLEQVAARATGVEALLAFVDTHRQLAQEEPDAMRAMLVLWAQSLISRSRMRETAVHDLLGHRDWVQRAIERGQAAGTVRGDADAHAEAVQFCGSLFGLTLQWLIDPASADLEPTLARFRERVARALRP